MVLFSSCSSVLDSVVLPRELLGDKLPFLVAWVLSSSSAMTFGSCWEVKTKNSTKKKGKRNPSELLSPERTPTGLTSGHLPLGWARGGRQGGCGAWRSPKLARPQPLSILVRRRAPPLQAELHQLDTRHQWTRKWPQWSQKRCLQQQTAAGSGYPAPGRSPSGQVPREMGTWDSRKAEVPRARDTIRAEVPREMGTWDSRKAEVLVKRRHGAAGGQRSPGPGPPSEQVPRGRGCQGLHDSASPPVLAAGEGTGDRDSRVPGRGAPGQARRGWGRTGPDRHPPPPPPPGPAARRARSAPTRTHLRATTAGARPASCRAGSVQFGPVRSPPRAAAPRATGTESAEPQRDAPAGPASRFFLIGYGAAGLPGYCALL